MCTWCRFRPFLNMSFSILIVVLTFCLQFTRNIKCFYHCMHATLLPLLSQQKLHFSWPLIVSFLWSKRVLASHNSIKCMTHTFVYPLLTMAIANIKQVAPLDVKHILNRSACQAIFCSIFCLRLIMYILTTLEFPTHYFDFHLLTTSVNAKYYILFYFLSTMLCKQSRIPFKEPRSHGGTRIQFEFSY